MQALTQLIEFAPIAGVTILLAAFAVQTLSNSMEAKPVKIRRDCCRRSK